jgi:hypothetical protein
MSDFLDELWKSAQANLDFLLIAGAVVIVQVLKRIAKSLNIKTPNDVWLGVILLFGVLLAWIEIPVATGHGKEFASACFKYAGGSVVTFEIWRRFGPRLTKAWTALKSKP